MMTKWFKKFTTLQQAVAVLLVVASAGAGAALAWQDHLGDLAKTNTQVASNTGDINLILVASMRSQLYSLEKQFGGRACPGAPPAIQKLCSNLEIQIFKRLGGAVNVPTPNRNRRR